MARRRGWKEGHCRTAGHSLSGKGCSGSLNAMKGRLADENEEGADDGTGLVSASCKSVRGPPYRSSYCRTAGKAPAVALDSRRDGTFPFRPGPEAGGCLQCAPISGAWLRLGDNPVTRVQASGIWITEYSEAGGIFFILLIYCCYFLRLLYWIHLPAVAFLPESGRVQAHSLGQCRRIVPEIPIRHA